MISRITLIAAIALSAACGGDTAESDKRAAARDYYRSTNTVIPAENDIIALTAKPVTPAGRPAPNPERNAYFGDLHVHTTLSFDASAFGTTASAVTAHIASQDQHLAGNHQGLLKTTLLLFNLRAKAAQFDTKTRQQDYQIVRSFEAPFIRWAT